ncbi:MAG: ClpXP protease specificity-enhancing factor SspB [Acidobacteriota bacterium]
MTLDTEPAGLDYAAMVQDALRSIARRALEQVADSGLPGAHHFYLTFRTQMPGVEMSRSLLDQYPDEMTVVLQHDYRDLDVDSDAFAVTLRFSGVPHRLIVPFPALTAFYDPSAQFLLRFEGDEAAADGEPAVDGPGPRPVVARAEPARPLADAARADQAWDAAAWGEDDGVDAGGAVAGGVLADAEQAAEDEAGGTESAFEQAASEKTSTDKGSTDKGSTDSSGSADNVVSIDRFRRDR